MTTRAEQALQEIAAYLDDFDENEVIPPYIVRRLKDIVAPYSVRTKNKDIEPQVYLEMSD